MIDPISDLVAMFIGILLSCYVVSKYEDFS